MNTKRSHGTMHNRLVSLNAGETSALDRLTNGRYVEITVDNGIGRISTHQEGKTEDVTLAFASRFESCNFYHPKELEIRIEAMTDTTYYLSYSSQPEENYHDSIVDWIIQLHVVRHETNTETRVMKLFELLTTRLGKRTREGFALEHNLPHARIAEIIGTTRSTVSRAISALKRKEIIYIDELKNQLLIPVGRINDHTDMTHPST